MQVETGKLQVDAQGKQEKLQSETQLNLAKIDQEQQKINNDARDKFIKNAIAIAELEYESQQEQNSNIKSNMQLGEY